MPSAADKLHKLLTTPDVPDVQRPAMLTRFPLAYHGEALVVQQADGCWRPFRVLAVCERGNSRSVGLCCMLKDGYGVETLACGIRALSDNTWAMLYGWADIVVLMHAPLLRHVPATTREKVVVCEVGPDVYWQGLPTELREVCKAFIEGEAFLGKDVQYGRVLRG